MTDAQRIIRLEQQVAYLQDEIATQEDEHPLERQSRLIRDRHILKKVIDEAHEHDCLVVIKWCRPEVEYSAVNKSGAMSKSDTMTLLSILHKELIDSYQDIAKVRLVPNGNDDPNGATA